MSADALALACFFDGKRPQPARVLQAMAAADRLGDWLAAHLGLSRQAEPETLADLLLLHVAAHESLAYLLFTTLVRLAGQRPELAPRTPAGWRALLQEATR